MILFIILIFVLILLTLAGLIDWRRKKKKNDFQITINSNAKPGDSTNYQMGDNKYTNGGE